MNFLAHNFLRCEFDLGFESGSSSYSTAELHSLTSHSFFAPQSCPAWPRTWFPSSCLQTWPRSSWLDSSSPRRPELSCRRPPRLRRPPRPVLRSPFPTLPWPPTPLPAAPPPLRRVSLFCSRPEPSRFHSRLSRYQ